jgi:ATP-dependent Clp protease ATP-binding subunit ClpA
MDVIRHIVDMKINIIRERLAGKNIELTISDEAMSYLAREGYNPHYGARPLGRLIQNKILNPIASFIISKGVKKGDIVNVILKDNDLIIEMNKKKIKSDFKVAKPSPYTK